MYNESLLHQVLHQIKATLLKVTVVFILFLAISILTAVNVSNNLGMILLVAGVCLSLFIWGMHGAPAVSYYHFVKNILNGRSRTIRGIVKKIDSQPVYKDNRLFYFEILLDEDGEERLLLMDANSPIQGLEEGRYYRFDIHENFIKDVGILQSL